MLGTYLIHFHKPLPSTGASHACGYHEAPKNFAYKELKEAAELDILVSIQWFMGKDLLRAFEIIPSENYCEICASLQTKNKNIAEGDTINQNTT